MAGTHEARLRELGIELPDQGSGPRAGGNYVPFVVAGDMVYVSGQISQTAAGPVVGRLGDDMSFEEGAVAARHCAVSLLTQLKAACDGDLDRLVRIVKLTG